jgi:hypothetical protein
MEHSQKINGTPLRVNSSDEGGSAYTYHLSHVVNKAIKGFWERRGMEEPGHERQRELYGRLSPNKKENKK